MRLNGSVIVLIGLFIVSFLFILRKLNIIGSISVERMFQGPYTFLYREYIDMPRKRALSMATENLKKVNANKLPLVILSFKNNKKSQQPKNRFWIGVLIHTEQPSEYPALFKDYNEDCIYKDMYSVSTVMFNSRLTAMLMPKRISPKISKHVHHCLLEVYDQSKNIIKFIADPYVKSLFDE